MIELTINTPFTTVIDGIGYTAPSDAALYLDGGVSSIPFQIVNIVGTNMWTVSFTPTSTGIYSFYVFGTIKFRIQCFNKSIFSLLTNIEDEALGSWSWNKTTGDLTVYRQNGSVMAIHKITDSTTESSRERIS